MTDDLSAYLRDVLPHSDSGVVTFQHLSDEETAALEDPSGFTVLPWIESQKHLDAASSSLFGRRSLYLRGLLAIETDPQTGEPALNPTDELRFVSDTRRLGVAYVFARATQHGERTARNIVLQAQSGGYEEDIDTDGFHHFSACTYRALLRRLAEWAVPYVHAVNDLHTSVPMKRWSKWTYKQFGPDVRVVEINALLPDGTGQYASQVWNVASAHGSAVLGECDNSGSLNLSSGSANKLETLLGDHLRRTLAVDP